MVENRRWLKNLLDENNAGTMILTGASNIIYATGLRDPSRILVLSRKCGDFMIVPLLDYHRVESRLPRAF